MFLSLASLKQQVMVGVCSNTHLSARIRVETPAILLPLHDLFTDVLVVLNLHAFIFFQPTSPPDCLFRQVFAHARFSKRVHAHLIGYFGKSLNTCFRFRWYSLKALLPFFVSLSAVCGFRSMNSLTIST